MATPKTPKVMDVKRPEKVTPPASGRPLIVTNRPILPNDPMMVPEGADDTAAKPAESLSRTAKAIKPLDETLQVSAPTAPETTAPVDVPAEPVTGLPAEPPVAQAEVTPKAAGSPVVEITSPSKAAGTEADKAVAELPETPAGPEAAKPESASPAAPAQSAAVPPAEANPVNTGPTQPAEPAALGVPEEDTPGRDAAAEVAAEDAAALEARTARAQELEQLIASGKYNVPINAVQRKRSRIVVTLLCLLGVVLAVALADVALDAGLFKTPIRVPHTNFLSGAQ